MKKISKLFLLLIIIISCESEELIDVEAETIENEAVEAEAVDEEFEIKSKSSDNNNEASKSSTAIEVINTIPLETETVFLYLDMDQLEENCQGSYNGSFSHHFRNEMSNNFTIYNVEYADPTCENYEKWQVNKSEYNVYILGNGNINGIITGPSSGGANTSSGPNSSISGPNGQQPPKGTLPPPPPDLEPTDLSTEEYTMLLFLNANCFQ